MLIYRVGGTILNNTDPIVISTVVGTAVLGYYSNYMLIIGSIITITEVAFIAVNAGVGNLITAGGSTRARGVFDEFDCCP